jgi:signal peptidase I
MTRPTLTHILAAVLAVAALAAFWVTLAPSQLGGGAAYALVVGSSMEPGLERGDLAVVRRADRYEPGDVVLYHDRRLGRDILHRIVVEQNGRFVTKGDNNDYRDDFRPSPADVTGRLWVTVPALGAALQWLRAPSHAALVVALSVLLALVAGAGAGAARGRRRTWHPRLDGSALLTAAIGMLAAFGLLALPAWTRPATHTVVDHAYAQQGRLDYRAPSSARDVYPDGAADTGEPVFLRLADTVNLRFAWKLEGDEVSDVGGTAGLEAVVSDGRGWDRELTLAPVRSFTGSTVTLAGRLDLAELTETLERVDNLTGAGITTWSLKLRPSVTASGLVDGERRTISFARDVPFELDPVRLGPEARDGSAVAALAPRIEQTAERRVGSTLPLGLPVAWARLLSLVGLAVAVALVAAARSGLRGRDELPEHERIAARHGHLLVEAAAPVSPPGRVVELEDFESVLRVAEASDRLIVHARTELGHEYAVEVGGSLLRYRSGTRLEPEAWLRVAAAGR